MFAAVRCFTNPVSHMYGDLPMVRFAVVISSCPPCVLRLYIGESLMELLFVVGGIFNPRKNCFGPRPLFASPAHSGWKIGAGGRFAAYT